MKLVWLQVGAADRDSIVWHITRARYSHAHAILVLQGRTWWRRFTSWHPCAEDVGQRGMGSRHCPSALQAACELVRRMRDRERARAEPRRARFRLYLLYSLMILLLSFPSEKPTKSITVPSQGVTNDPTTPTGTYVLLLPNSVNAAHSITAARFSFQGAGGP